MSWFARIRNVIRPNGLSDDLDRELSFHIAERIDDLVAHGMTPDAARREARRQFGNYGLQKEYTRERDVFRWLETLLGDLRYALRTLRASPAFALVAILSLALGIGANTAIFSLINAVMLKSLPVSHPEELMVVVRDSSKTATNPIWEYVRDHQDVFSGTFAYSPTQFNLASRGQVRNVYANWVSGAYFSTLGVRAVLGRTLLPADDVRGCPAVAAISSSFWQTEYGGSDAVIGRTVALDGHQFQIVGVIDPAFFGLDVGAHAQIYTPLCAQTIMNGDDKWIDARSTWYLHIVGRPKPGITPAQASARLQMLMPGLVEATLPPNWPPDAAARYQNARMEVASVATGFSDLRTTYRKALFVLMTVVGIVLLIACANVANLLLARATKRQHEIAVRLALGARPARLIRQLLTESVLLALMGAAIGVVFAIWGSHLLLHLMSTSGDAVALDLSLDLPVLAFTAGVAVATGVLFGLAPAWRAARVAPHNAMKSQARGVADGHSRFSVGKALVVAQIALSLLLVAGAVLLLGSWRRLATVDPGFKRDHVLLLAADMRSGNENASPEQRSSLRRQLLDRLRAVPGVRMASASELTPISGAGWNNDIKADGYAPASRDDGLVWMNEVSDGYFSTMGTALITGRDFNTSDVPGSAKVAIVNEALARKVFGTRSPIGQHIQVANGKDYGPPIEIVGVVGNAKYESMRETPQPIAYISMAQDTDPGLSVKVEIRTVGPTTAIIPSIKSAVAEVAPRASLDFTTLDRQVAESLRLPRTLATLAGFFGVLALLLATIGLYGIMSYTVARRRNEIGVRIALGARQSRVVRMVMGEVGLIVGLGVGIGILLTLGLTRLVSAFLYGVAPSDPTTMVLSAVMLAGVAFAAAMLPAWRAARLDPVTALREN
ncbi:MAG TPA: ABC transporter permease [Gemmatimonadaceae bacterium]|nr:ABC transporter permease [Gemmatimonadaceae bacterium]